jgi:hypothetical protein
MICKIEPEFLVINNDFVHLFDAEVEANSPFRRRKAGRLDTGLERGRSERLWRGVVEMLLMDSVDLSLIVLFLLISTGRSTHSHARKMLVLFAKPH